jgi:molybdopterin synthase catalytic subunit
VKVVVVGFASARDALGGPRVELDLPGDSTSLEALAGELCRRFPDLLPHWSRLALAVDGRLATADTVVGDGAEVALLPPVSGGGAEPASLVAGEPDPVPLLAAVADPAHGATVLFVGRVRAHRAGRAVTHLTYEAYGRMALEALRRIVGELEGPGTCRVALSHRLGEARAGETTVAIAVSAAHREAAYAVSRLALERLKREVPIWKREHYADGAADWLEVEPLTRS